MRTCLLGSGYFSDPSMAAAIYLYVPDVDATYQRALEPRRQVGPRTQK